MLIITGLVKKKDVILIQLRLKTQSNIFRGGLSKAVLLYAETRPGRSTQV